MTAKGKKYIDTSWDFRDADTKYSAHGLHTYPAMMIPQVARRLILNFSNEGDNIIDPFCGSGTVLAESKLTARNSYGFDINPLALLISKVKITPIEPEKLKKVATSLLISVFHENINYEPPKFFNIDYWFKPQVIIALAKIKGCILRVEDEDLRDFFWICFSSTVREASNTRNGEFKLFRISPDKLAYHNPNALDIFKEVVYRNVVVMGHFYRNHFHNVSVKVLNKDMRYDTELPSKYFDALVTSPPYGDSRTTVAYGQFSRLSSQWLSLISDGENLDRQSLGGNPTKNLNNNLPSVSLKNVLDRIANKDRNRAKDVLSFYEDLNKTLVEIERIMKNGSFVCFVVGNRTVKGVKIPTDDILVELLGNIGFTHVETIIRNIPNKTMPLQNSPTNIAGEIQDTMHQEYIVIMRKVE